jgi:hypothetical protein
MSERLGEETLARMQAIGGIPSPLKSRGVSGSPLRVMFSTPRSSYVPRQVMSERALRKSTATPTVSTGFTTPTRETAVREVRTSPRKKPTEMRGKSLASKMSSATPDRGYSREKKALETQYKLFKILGLTYPTLSVKEMEARVRKCEVAIERRQREQIAERDEQWQEYEKRITRKFILRERELQETNEALQIKTQELSVRMEQLEEQLEKEREEKGVIQFKTDRVARKHTFLERELLEREGALAKIHAEMEKLEKAFKILQQQKAALQQRETEEQAFSEAQIG